MLACSNVSIIGLNNITLVASTLTNVTLYLLGISTGHPCLLLKAFLSNLSSTYGFHLVWIPIDKVQSPMLSKATLMLLKAGLSPAVPITIVTVRNNTVAVVEGAVLDKGFWLKLVSSGNATKGVKVYLGTKLIGVVNTSILRESIQAKSFDPLPLIIAAFTDSLNPVGLTILGLIVLYCVNTKKKCYKEASLAILSYVAAHMTLGLTLSSLPASSFYPVLGVVIASIVIIFTLKPNKRAMKVLNNISNKLSVAALRGGSVVLIGAAAGSIAMSPCVVGAFLSAMSTIGSVPFPQKLYYLLLYMVIYPIPAISVVLAIHKGKGLIKPRRLILILASLSLVLSFYSLLKQFGYYP